MSTPEQTTPQTHPVVVSTLSAASKGTVVGGEVAATPTLVAVGVQTRAIAAATQQVVEALAQFAQARRATIIPLLQADLVEHFQTRTPSEISKLLGQEQAREREFLKRQAARIRRDLPKVLGEADLDDRREAMRKLMTREQRYMGQRERAMTARAHSLVESLDLQETSPEGAYWLLGGPVHQHTPGCVAMSNKFWPWKVLREVMHPPVHPGCPCSLLSLDEAVNRGLMKADQLPDVKDALLRARRNLELEEAIAETFPQWQIEDEMRLLEVEHPHIHHESHRLRFAKGLVKGGEFMPKYGQSNRVRTKALIGRKLGSRSVWIKGHKVSVPAERSFHREVGGHSFTSPPGSTNVYRDGKLVSTDDRPSMHPDMRRPTGGPAKKGRVTKPGKATPSAIRDAEAQKANSAGRRVERALRSGSADVAPVRDGQNAHEAHGALTAGGFRADTKGSAQTDASLTVPYEHRDGHLATVTYDRASSKVAGVNWKPGDSPSDTTAMRGALGIDKPKPKAATKPEAPAKATAPQKAAQRPRAPEPQASPTLGTGDPVWERQLARAISGEPEAQWDLAQELQARGPNSEFARQLRQQAGARRVNQWTSQSAWPHGDVPQGAAPAAYSITRTAGHGEHGPSIGVASGEGVSGGVGDPRPFGTGHYFTSRPMAGSHGESVSFAGAHLHRPRSSDEARALGHGLGILNSLAGTGETFVPGVDPRSGERRLWTLDDVIDRLPRSVDRDDAYTLADDAMNRQAASDESASTHLMRGLGYDGVDTRHLADLDTPSYGSVVYAAKEPDRAAPALTQDEAISPAATEAVRVASEAIARVLHLPDPIKIKALPDSDTATARSHADGSIGVHGDSSQAVIANAIVHEMGHLLDRTVLGNEDDWFTSSEGDAASLYQTLRDTPTMKSVTADEPQILKGDSQTRNYMLSGREMFARAFHQYIAEKSQDPTLVAELRKIQGDEYGSFQFWQDDEFKPVARALDKILAPYAAGPAPGEAKLDVRQYEGKVGRKDHTTRTESGLLPIGAVRNLHGAAGEIPGEHRNRQGAEWDAFVNDIAENGVKSPIFITVDHGGNPRISEGNHRRDAAIAAGLTHVPVNISYFGKSEDQGTVMGRYSTMASPAQGGAVLKGTVGRWVWIRGRVNFVPQDQGWERTVDGIRFASPAGGTKIYRAEEGQEGLGELVNEPKKHATHPDVRNPKVGGTKRGGKPGPVILTPPGDDEGETETPSGEDEPPARPSVPEGTALALTDEQRDALLTGSPEGWDASGIFYAPSQRDAVNAGGLPDGRLTFGSLWDRMTPEERQRALDTAYGHVLASRISADDGARDDLGKLWTAQKFEREGAEPGRKEYLDRYSAEAGIAKAYASMGAEDWRVFAGQYPDVARFTAEQADTRGYYLRPDVQDWLKSEDNAHDPVQPLPPLVRMVADQNIGRGPRSVDEAMFVAGFSQHGSAMDGADSIVTYRGINGSSVETVAVRFRENPQGEMAAYKVEGTSYQFDANSVPAEGDTPERLAYEIRGMGASEMVRKMNAAGYFSLTARHGYEKGMMENVFVKPDSDIGIMVRTPDSYEQPVRDGRPTTLSAGEIEGRMAAIAQTRPDRAFAPGTPSAMWAEVAKRTGWQIEQPGGEGSNSVVLIKAAVSLDGTYTVDAYHVDYDAGGAVISVGRPTLDNRQARNDAEWIEYRRTRQNILNQQIVEQKARQADLEEKIRVAVNAGEAPDIKGAYETEIRAALYKLGYYDLEDATHLQHNHRSQAWTNSATGARLVVRVKPDPLDPGDRVVVSARVSKSGKPDYGRERTAPGVAPMTVDQWTADLKGFSDELAGRFPGAISDVTSIAFSGPSAGLMGGVRNPTDHAGFHDADGMIGMGHEARATLETLHDARAADRDLRPDQLDDVYKTYLVGAHEVAHGVHVRDYGRQYEAEDGSMGIEEWLTEDLAHQLAIENLERHGHWDVLEYAQAHERELRQHYQTHRTNAYRMMGEMGIPTDQMSAPEIRSLLEHWKFESSNSARRSEFREALMANVGLNSEQAEAHISTRMGILEQRDGMYHVKGFQPLMAPAWPTPPPDVETHPIGSWVQVTRHDGGDLGFDGPVGQITQIVRRGQSPVYQIDTTKGSRFRVRDADVVPVDAPKGPDVPVVHLPDGGRVPVDGMVRDERGRIGKVSALQGFDDRDAIEVEWNDGDVDDALPEALTSVAITRSGHVLRPGAIVYDPTTDQTGRVGTIDWSDAFTPRVQFFPGVEGPLLSGEPDGSGILVPMRTLQSRAPEADGREWTLPITGRDGNPRYLGQGSQVRMADGTMGELRGVDMPDWPVGPINYRVSIDGHIEDVPADAIIEPANELPTLKPQRQAVDFQRDLHARTLLAEQAKWIRNPDFRPDGGAPIAVHNAAGALASDFADDYARSLGNYFEAKGIDLDGRSPRAAVNAVFEMAYRSPANWAQIQKDRPEITAAVTQLAREAGYPMPPNWSREPATQGAEALPDYDTFHSAFEAAMADSPYRAFVSHYTPQEMAEKHMQPLTTNGGQTGVLVYDHGNGDVEATALYNQSDVRGAGLAILQQTIDGGVNYVECFGDGLSTLYGRLGFVDSSVSPFDEQFAPEGWNYALHDHPDYHVMRLPGNPNT